MSPLLAKLSPRNWGRAFRAVFGSYRPPPWPGAAARGLYRSSRRHPAAWASTVLVLGILAGSAWYGYRWWKAHQPKPRQLVQIREVSGNITGPGDTVFIKGKPPEYRAVLLKFSGATAPLDKIGKASSDVTLTPSAAGEWKWTDDRTLVFKPEKEWPAATTYEVKLAPGSLPKETHVKEPRWEFTTTPLEAKFSSTEFYTDPHEPTVHEVVTELNFNRPMDLKEVESHLSLAVLGDSPLFAPKGQKPASYFKVTEGEHQRQFFVRSARLTIPEKEDFVRLTFAKGSTTTLGGQPLKEAVSAKVRVPNVFSGFFIDASRTEIIRTGEGEPEQYLFVETKGYVEGSELEKHVKVWFIPEFEETDHHKLPESAAAVTEAVMRDFKMTPVALKRVETEKAEGAPVSTSHAFKYLIERPGQLLVRVSQGVNALGGFRLERDFSQYAAIVRFPKEVGITGEGGLLALNGERKIGIKSRGLPWLRITLARVPFSQVQHLARFTEGDFQSPYFRGWVDESNIAHFYREVRKMPMRNEFEAVYTNFDFTEAIKRADASDPDGSRGMFFIIIEGVQPKKQSKRRLVGDDTLSDWKAIRQGDSLLTEEELNAEMTDEEKAAEERAARRDEDSDDEAVSTKRFVLVTDLGLLVKRSAAGTRDIFLQSVQKGEPVGGVGIIVLAKNGEILAQGTTGADGRASLANVEHLKQEKKAVAIIARQGNDVSFIPFQRPDRLMDFSRFDVGGVLASEKETLEASLFTERGIYRPGDPVHIGGVVRRRDWQGKLEGLPLELQVSNSKDQVISTEKYPLTPDGYLDMTAKTAESDPTGVYVAHLYLVKNETHKIALGRAVFRVEDFQPDRMKSELALNKPDAGWITPEDVRATLTVKTLFGFPAANRNVKAKLTLNAAEFAFEQYPDFTFNNRLLEQTRKLAGQEVELGEQKTNENGEAEIRLALERFEGGCFNLNLFAEVFEADGGRSVRAGKSVLVAPFNTVIGYKADGSLDFIGKDSVRQLKVIAIGPDLKKRVVEGLTYKVIQIRHVSVLTKKENGNYAYVSTKRESQTAEGPFALTADGVSYSLPSSEVGDFRFELHDAENHLVCAVPFTIAGKGDAGRELERNSELELKLARDTWNSGEELELNYRAPYTGAGLITIEREGVFASKWFKASTNSGTEHITVPPGLEGTAYVNVSFVRALDSKEVFMSPLSYAVQPFTANPDTRRMTVTLDAAKIIKPGEVLHIGYKTSRPGRIMIYAVDAGMHQITNYKLPDPLKTFFTQRALEVETEQLLDLILPEFSLLKDQKAFGGDESALKMNLNPFKRRRDPPVVFWSGLLEADSTQRETTYTLPDYFAGQLNIMAVAVTPDAIGTAETKNIVRGPMVLTPNVPVFAAPGDEFTASLTVANNLEGADASSDMALTVSSTTGNLEFIEASEQKLQVAPAHESTARFRVRVKDGLGNAELIFHAVAGGQAMERRATLSVRPAQPYMTRVQSGYFRLPKQDITTARDMFPQYRKTNATVSVLPLGLAVGLERYLAEYPHGCSEQITSRAMGRLLLTSEADFGFDKADAVRALDTAFTLLRSRQNSNGGFGYWDASCDDRFEFLSLYVTHFLTEAAEAGYAVPASLLDGARNRMKQMARLEVNTLSDMQYQAEAIYLLTRNGEVTTNYVLNLRDTLAKRFKDQWEGNLGAVYLAATYELLKEDKEARRVLDSHFAAVKNKRFGPWNGWYYTDPHLLKTQEFALICRHFPDIASGYGYSDLASITEPIVLGQFNTITAAQSILALKAYSQLSKKSDVRLAIRALPRGPGEPQILVPASGGLLSVPFDAASGGIRFELDQAGHADLGAFYQVTEAGFDKGMPKEKVSDGLEVFRELVDAQDHPVEKLRVGDGAKLRVQVRNISPAPQNNIALLDLLPGGFEVEPEALKPGLNTVPGAEFTEVREDRNIFYCSLAKGETKTFSYRIKPVAAGTFVIPPAFAESMYDRGIHGRSSGGQVVVDPAP